MSRNAAKLDDVRDPNVSIEDSKVHDSIIGHSVNIIDSTIEESDVPSGYKFDNEVHYMASGTQVDGSTFVHKITGTDAYEPELFNNMFDEEVSPVILTDDDLLGLNNLEDGQGLSR